MNIAGMMASSTNLSAVNLEANLTKTAAVSKRSTRDHVGPTQARCKQRDIEIGGELLHFRIEQSVPGSQIARQTDTNDFQHGLEDQ